MMTTLEGTMLSSSTPGARIARRRPQGRPVLFATLLALAGLLVLVVLVGGPVLPMTVFVPCALASIALVIIGWVLAGPRW